MVDDELKELLPILGVAFVAFFAILGELLHWRRIRRVANLAFGPQQRPMPWVYATPFLRVIAFSSICWGLLTLYFLPPESHREGEVKPHEIRRLLLVLDVSPSMKLQDSGQLAKQRRDERAADILRSFFDRVQKDRYRTTIIATYTEAKPVVQDTTDLEVVKNILTDLPLSQAFKSGSTDLLAGVREAVKISQPWPPGSTVLMIVSDGGDPPTNSTMPKLPDSISHVVVVGVGNPTVGKFIDGTLSRQDVPSLRQIAARLKGTYHNGNEQHLGSELISTVSESPGGGKDDPWTKREYALLAIVTGSGFLTFLPLLLQLFGTMWKVGYRPQTTTSSPRTLIPIQ